MCELYTMIDKRCKERGTNVTQMCNSLNLTRSMLSELKAERTKSLTSDVLVKIADHLECSIDYLLGRTENSQSHNCVSSMSVGDVYGNNGAIGVGNTVNAATALDEHQRLLIELYNKLSPIEQVELLSEINQRTK